MRRSYALESLLLSRSFAIAKHEQCRSHLLAVIQKRRLKSPLDVNSHVQTGDSIMIRSRQIRIVRQLLGAVTLAAGVAAPVQAAPIVYTTDATFLAAAGGGLIFESFETATQAGTVVTYPGGTFSCSGASFCPGFFGISPAFADTGTRSVYFATPDSATFTFAAPVTAFGIAIGGAGDVAPLTLTALLSNGSSVTALGPGYVGSFDVFGSNRQYFGVIDTVPFVSVTFSGSNTSDGIFFDSMSRGLASATAPEPGSLLLFGTALAGWLARRKVGTTLQ
jgi:hypothetical protein